MKTMRERRRQGLRELRLVVPDAGSSATRRRLADQLALLNSAAERDAMQWIEAVSDAAQ